eukprot:gene1579-12704_t
MKYTHIPVLLKEVVDNLNLKSGKLAIDCTFGIGGYSQTILKKFENVKLYSFDLDSKISKPYVLNLQNEFQERFNFKNENFKNIDIIANEENKKENFVDGICYDLGLNSIQLSESERGFSFKNENNGPLDMRMNSDSYEYPLASEVLNSLNEYDLIDMFKEGGENKMAFKLSKEIIKFRSIKPFETTNEFTNLIEKVYGNKKMLKNKRNSSTKAFQALRIYVNDEFRSLKISLEKSNKLLKIGGRMCIVTFHSGEERIVDQFLSQNKNLKLLKTISPEEEEIESNPRSRSSILRVIEKKK